MSERSYFLYFPYYVGMHGRVKAKPEEQQEDSRFVSCLRLHHNQLLELLLLLIKYLASFTDTVEFGSGKEDERDLARYTYNHIHIVHIYKLCCVVYIFCAYTQTHACIIKINKHELLHNLVKTTR